MIFLMANVLILFLSTGTNQPLIQFQDVTGTSGLAAPLAGMMGHAAAWGDFNNDGLPDLFVAGFCDRPDKEYLPAKGPVPAKLFAQMQNRKFQLSKEALPEICGRTAGALFFDLNQDRFPELYVANNSRTPAKLKAQALRSMFFKNEKGLLRIVPESKGACPPDLLTARSIGVLDYNNDRLLDLFLVEDKFKKKQAPKSVLLKHEGNFAFRNVNAEAGLPEDIYGFGIAIADLNDDARPDFFITHSNRLFLSVPGNKYREATELKEVFQWNPVDNEDWPSGAVFGDLNLDGRMDLVVAAHHEPARNRVYINNGLKDGIPQFQEASARIGMGVNIPAKSPHVEIQDFDNDGLPDIYLSAAWQNQGTVIPLIYRNQGIQKNGLPQFAPIQEIKSPMIYFPVGPTADFNQDGKMDILLVNWFSGGASRLLENNSRPANWVAVKAPLGSTIKLLSSGKLIGYQQLYIGYGFGSGQLPICHFGLGEWKTADLEVTLPGGEVKRFKNININKVIEL